MLNGIVIVVDSCNLKTTRMLSYLPKLLMHSQYLRGTFMDLATQLLSMCARRKGGKNCLAGSRHYQAQQLNKSMKKLLTYFVIQDVFHHFVADTSFIMHGIVQRHYKIYPSDVHLCKTYS